MLEVLQSSCMSITSFETVKFNESLQCPVTEFFARAELLAPKSLTTVWNSGMNVLSQIASVYRRYEIRPHISSF